MQWMHNVFYHGAKNAIRPGGNSPCCGAENATRQFGNFANCDNTNIPILGRPEPRRDHLVRGLQS